MFLPGLDEIVVRFDFVDGVPFEKDELVFGGLEIAERVADGEDVAHAGAFVGGLAGPVGDGGGDAVVDDGEGGGLAGGE